MGKISKAKEGAKKVVKKTFKLSNSESVYLDPVAIKSARVYINKYWKKLERYHPEDDESLLGLPYTYLVPSYREKTGFDYNEMYYWDSYFMVMGLLTNSNQALNEGILEDLIYQFKRFKIIPNASRTYLTGRSQPPFLSSLILDIYVRYDKSDKWLYQKIKVAEAEYHTVWRGLKKPNEREVYQGLSRYYDINYLHDLAEAESGWDMTPRFNRKALHFLPVDLNALLYKYESDFAHVYMILNDQDKVKYWNDQANQRKDTMNDLMWDNSKGIYFDYNYDKKKRSDVISLATYFPMWAGLASNNQAKKLVKNIKRFEHKGGLATTDTLQLGQFVPGSMPTQWAYPNGWAPLHFIVVRALERYGYHEDAKRIALKWLKTNLDWFNKNQDFLEKYNVINPEKPPLKGVYPSQVGFGWTNAVFERFCQDYLDKNNT